MIRDNHLDYILLFVFIILVGFGIIMVLSSSMVFATYFYKDGLYFFKKQIISCLIGLISFLIFLKLRLSLLRDISPFILIFSILLLIAVFIPGIGREIKGAYRWIKIGFFNFQPSEIAKFSLILFLSSSLSKRKEKIKNFSEGFLPYILIFSTIFLLIVEEPDFGTAFIILAIFLAMIFIGGVKIFHILLFIFSGIFFAAILIQKEPYRVKRIRAFLTSFDDIQNTDYQAWQSLIALGSGRLKGMGLGNSRQKYLYLPQSHTDFIYAVICEELGFLGASLTILLFLVFLWRGWAISIRAPNLFFSYLAFGLTFYIVFQAFLNMGVVTGILPITGVQLPFISYGGTSLIINMASTGIILNISQYKKIIKKVL